MSADSACLMRHTHLCLVEESLVKHGLLSDCLGGHAKSDLLGHVPVLLSVQFRALVRVSFSKTALPLSLFVSVVAKLVSLLGLSVVFCGGDDM